MKHEDDYDRRAQAAGERVKKLLDEEGAQVQALFDRIAKRHGLPTAKTLFERCVRLAKEPSPEEEQKHHIEKVTKEKEARTARALTKLPTLEKIASADRAQICEWWYRWPDRKLEKKERDIYDALWRRYFEFGGYPEDFDPKRLTPIKKPGSVKRNALNRELVVLFDVSNPESEFSKETLRRGKKPTQTEFAEHLISKFGDRYGKDADNVVGNWKYWKKKI